MKRNFWRKPPSIVLPETGDLLDAISWIKDLDVDTVKKLKVALSNQNIFKWSGGYESEKRDTRHVYNSERNR